MRGLRGPAPSQSILGAIAGPMLSTAFEASVRWRRHLIASALGIATFSATLGLTIRVLIAVIATMCLFKAMFTLVYMVAVFGTQATDGRAASTGLVLFEKWFALVILSDHAE